MPRLSFGRKPAFWTTLLSVAGLIILMTVTDPADKLVYALVFFVLFFSFMVGLGYLLVNLQMGEVSHKNRYRIVAVSLVVLMLLMFRSAQSLSWVDAVILSLIAFGLGFYISRRA